MIFDGLRRGDGLTSLPSGKVFAPRSPSLPSHFVTRIVNDNVYRAFRDVKQRSVQRPASSRSQLTARGLCCVHDPCAGRDHRPPQGPGGRALVGRTPGGTGGRNGPGVAVPSLAYLRALFSGRPSRRTVAPARGGPALREAGHQRIANAGATATAPRQVFVKCRFRLGGPIISSVAGNGVDHALRPAGMDGLPWSRERPGACAEART